MRIDHNTEISAGRSLWQKYFTIADQEIIIRGETSERELYLPFGLNSFKTSQRESLTPLLTLQTGELLVGCSLPADFSFSFEELDLKCEFSVSDHFFEFRMFPDPASGSSEGNNTDYPVILRMPRESSTYVTNLSPRFTRLTEFSFLLWNAFGVASLKHSCISMHSSVIIYKGRAVLFLGESGTGKSTHTQLWLNTIGNCRLLNDDGPIVRIIDDEPLCYGSPWSGKGKRYLNESYPIAAFVRLRQSSSNQIRRLGKIEAFSALYPSCPPYFSCDSELTDYICDTLSVLIEKVPVFTLDCLPDREAALLSCSTIFGITDQRHIHE